MKIKISKKTFFISIFGVLFLYYLYDFIDFDYDQFSEFNNLIELKYIIFGALLYLSSHIIRALRLIIMTPDNMSYRYRELIFEQLKANGFNLLLPFKLGESYRVIAFKKFFRTYSLSFNILLLERFLDFFAIIVFFCVGLLISSSDIKAFDSLFYVSISLFITLALIFFVFKDFFIILNKSLLTKQPTKINLFLVQLSSTLLRSYDKINNIAIKKFPTLIVITIFIWAMEFGVFLIFFDFVNGNFDLLLLLGVAVALSTFLPNGPAGLGGVQLAFFIIGSIAQSDNAILYSLIYSFYIFGTGLFVALILFIIDALKGVLGID